VPITVCVLFGYVFGSELRFMAVVATCFLGVADFTVVKLVILDNN